VGERGPNINGASNRGSKGGPSWLLEEGVSDPVRFGAERVSLKINSGIMSGKKNRPWKDRSGKNEPAE